ncbi:cytochrome P450 monooxygenase [Fusarium globosum]|uniref:Cytochrome P450 monooxygenase n=1 Tax=Fusarium globosum TaxID=78864 RepID=A0A8H5UNT2_9HYPO|nr:cytochrome P450 monooxygenase [Fusarium globosum]
MEGLIGRTSGLLGLAPTSLHAALLAFGAGLASQLTFCRNEPTITDFLLALTALVITNGIYYTTIGLYRAFFHPLRNYPGPFLPRLTKWAWFMRYRTGRYHRWVYSMGQKYGDVVRLGPRDIVFFNPEDAALVNGPHSKLSKGTHADGSPWAAAHSVTFVKDTVEHRYRRRIWDQGFTTAALASYEPRIAHLLEEMVSKFQERDGAEINMTDWASFYSFDAMGDLGFGNDFNMVATGTTHPYREFLHKAFKMRSMWMTMPWCKYAVAYLPVDADIKAKAKQFTKFSNDRFDARRAQGQTRPDIFSHLLKQDVESGGKLTEAELREEARAIILAGSDTTAFALAMIFFNLVEHPELYTRVQEEVDALNAKGPFKGTTLGPEQIPLVIGAINETLRVFPPAPEPTQRTNGPTPTTINGQYIPPYTNCYVCPWALHRDDRYFSQPNDFIPERWVEALRPPKFNHNPKAFIPFGSGLYNCAGRALAALEMRQLLCTILYRFTFERGPHYNREAILDSLSSNGSMEVGPIHLVVRARKPAEGN